MFKKASLLCLIFFLILGGVNFAQASANDDLFSTADLNVPYPTPGHYTFVIWVNGDADHFVPVKSDVPGPLVRGDSIEVEHIQKFASQCYDCNVVIMHEQRGGERWYTTPYPWATYLRVYTRGAFLFVRKVSDVNGADPNTLAGLLQFADKLFPNSETHLIYRGHSFIPAYNPAHPNGVAPFVYSHPESPYGIQQFAESLALSNRKTRIKSVTFAACSMADVSAALAIAPYAEAMVAPQVDVLETVSTTFSFGFLADPTLGAPGKLISQQIAASLMQRFRDTSDMTEAMMEYPMSWIDLRPGEGLVNQTEGFLQSLEHSGLLDQLQKQAPVQKVLSDRYVGYLKASGESEAGIQNMIKLVRSDSDFKEIDWLRGLALIPAQSNLGQRAKAVLNLWRPLVKVYDRPQNSSESGMSLSLQDL